MRAAATLRTSPRGGAGGVVLGLGAKMARPQELRQLEEMQEQQNTRLAERPAPPPPLSRVQGEAFPAADTLQLQPPAIGTWLSTADRANREAMMPVWAPGGGGAGASQVELERSLRKAIKAQRDAEVRLQLELHNKVELSGVASRMMAERELLSAQVEDIRGRLLEAKLQNVKLRTELSIRVGHGTSGCRTCRARRSCFANTRARLTANNGGCSNRNRDCRHACCFAVVVAAIVGSMMIAFAVTMEL